MAGLLHRLRREECLKAEEGILPEQPVLRRVSKLKMALGGCCLMLLVVPSAGMMGMLYLLKSGKQSSVHRSAVAAVNSSGPDDALASTAHLSSISEGSGAEEAAFFKEVPVPGMLRESVRMIVSGTLDTSRFRITPEAVQGMIPGVDVSELRFVIERESTAGEEDMVGVDPDTKVVIYEFRARSEGEIMKEVILFQNGSVAMK